MGLEQDREGEMCPLCKNGKLHRSGFVNRKEPYPKPVSGERGNSEVWYECDDCHKRVNAIGIELGIGIGASASVKANVKQKYQDGTTIKCPNCEEDTLTYNKPEDIWRCSNTKCGYEEHR